MTAPYKRILLTIIILCALTCEYACCQWQEHHNIVYLSYIDGLSERDARLSLATDNVTAFNFEFMPDVSLVHEFETEMFIDGGELAALWKGGRDKGRLLGTRTNSDIIIVARHWKNSGAAITSNFRVFYMPLDGTVRSAFFELSNGSGDVIEYQKAVFESLVERLPLELPDDFWQSRSLAGDWRVFYLFGEGIGLLRSDRVEAGLNTLRRALDIAPFRDLKYFLGKFFVTRQFNYNLATKYLNSVIEENPGDAGAHYWLGFVYRLMGEYDRAAAELEKTITLKPGFLEAYIYLGTLYTDLGDLDRVIHYYESALEIAPFIPSVWYSLASVQALTGNSESALFSLRRCLELDAGTFYRLVRSDADLASLRNSVEFKELLREYKP